MYGYQTATVETISSNAREELILQHLPQVRAIANRVREQLPDSIALEDLVSAGVIGLIAAVDNFDHRHNASLRTYAEYRIRGAILDSIRGLDGVPAHKRPRMKQISAALATLEQQLHRTPTDEEIALEMGIELAEYHDWLLELRGVSLGDFDVTLDNGETVSILQCVQDHASPDPMELLERATLEKLLAEGLARVPQMERTILSLYYWDELTMREIAPCVNLHATRVCQLKTQAVLRLRTYIEARWPGRRGGAR